MFFDERSFAVQFFEQPFVDEMIHGFADRRPAHFETLHQLPFARDLFSVLVVQDLFFQYFLHLQMVRNRFFFINHVFTTKLIMTSLPVGKIIAENVVTDNSQ